jgi:DNA-binding transcriptional MerR regulator
VRLSLRTVRHYEDLGLVRPAGRTPGGFRLYDGEAIDRLRLILKMKPLGFGLEEMRRLVEIRHELASATVDGAPVEALPEALAQFSAAAEDHLTTLRAQLSHAEAFTALLDADVKRLS